MQLQQEAHPKKGAQTNFILTEVLTSVKIPPKIFFRFQFSLFLVSTLAASERFGRVFALGKIWGKSVLGWKENGDTCRSNTKRAPPD